MQKECRISIVPPLAPPPPSTELIIFSSNRNYTAEYDSSKMLATASRYAKQYNIHVVPERFVANGYLCLCLISPRGEAVAVQRACHLNLDYRGVFKRDDEIHVYKTTFGPLSLLVDVDANHPQVVRSAVSKGARLLISSQFIQPFDFFEDRVYHSVYNASMSNHVAMAAAISTGGILLQADAVLCAPYSESSFVTGTLLVDKQPQNVYKATTAMQILLDHKEYVIDEAEDAHHD